jgi:hypothetical protein
MTEHYTEKRKNKEKREREKKEKKRSRARRRRLFSPFPPRLSNAATHIKKSLNMIKFQVWI